MWLPINECAIDCATAADEAACMELPFCAWDGSACRFGGVGET